MKVAEAKELCSKFLAKLGHRVYWDMEDVRYSSNGYCHTCDHNFKLIYDLEDWCYRMKFEHWWHHGQWIELLCFDDETPKSHIVKTAEHFVEIRLTIKGQDKPQSYLCDKFIGLL